MFGDPLAAFAIALFFLRSALHATAAGGSGDGTDCACEACAGAAAVELVWVTGSTSLITLLMSSMYSCSSLVPSQRSAYAWLSKPKTSSMTTPSFALVFKSWNWSVVHAPLCLSLPNSALTRKAAAFMGNNSACCLALASRGRSCGAARAEQEFYRRRSAFFVGQSKACNPRSFRHDFVF